MERHLIVDNASKPWLSRQDSGCGHVHGPRRRLCHAGLILNIRIPREPHNAKATSAQQTFHSSGTGASAVVAKSCLCYGVGRSLDALSMRPKKHLKTYTLPSAEHLDTPLQDRQRTGVKRTSQTTVYGCEHVHDVFATCSFSFIAILFRVCEHAVALPMAPSRATPLLGSMFRQTHFAPFRYWGEPGVCQSAHLHVPG